MSTPSLHTDPSQIIDFNARNWHSDVRLVPLDEGGFIMWGESDVLYGQFIDETGNPVGAKLNIGSGLSSTLQASTVGDRILINWQEKSFGVTAPLKARWIEPENTLAPILDLGDISRSGDPYFFPQADGSFKMTDHASLSGGGRSHFLRHFGQNGEILSDQEGLPRIFPNPDALPAFVSFNGTIKVFDFPDAGPAALFIQDRFSSGLGFRAFEANLVNFTDTVLGVPDVFPTLLDYRILSDGGLLVVWAEAATPTVDDTAADRLIRSAVFGPNGVAESGIQDLIDPIPRADGNIDLSTTELSDGRVAVHWRIWGNSQPELFAATLDSTGAVLHETTALGSIPFFNSTSGDRSFGAIESDGDPVYVWIDADGALRGQLAGTELSRVLLHPEDRSSDSFNGSAAIIGVLGLPEGMAKVVTQEAFPQFSANPYQSTLFGKVMDLSALLDGDSDPSQDEPIPGEDPNDTPDDGEEAEPPQILELEFGKLTLVSDLAWKVGETTFASAPGAAITVIHNDSDAVLMRVEDGEVTISGEEISIDGRIYSAAPITAPIMLGSFAINGDTLAVSDFTDRDSSDSHRLGGMVETIMASMRVTEGGLILGGDLRLSDQFSALTTNGSPIAFNVSSAGIRLLPSEIGTGRWLSDSPLELGLPGGSGLELSLSDIFAQYSLSEDAFYLGGRAALSWGGQVGNQLQLFGIERGLTLDLAGDAETWERGDKFIRIQRSDDGWNWDVVGEIKYEASSNIDTPGFAPRVTEATLNLNTIEQSFGGSLTAKLPPLRGASLQGEFKAYWDPLALDEVSLTLADARIPLATTGLMITGGSVGVTGLSGRDESNPIRQYEFDTTLALATPAAIPSPFTGGLKASVSNETITGTLSLSSTLGDLIPGSLENNALAKTAQTWFGVDLAALRAFNLMQLDGTVSMNPGGGSNQLAFDASFLNGAITGNITLSQSYELPPFTYVEGPVAITPEVRSGIFTFDGRAEVSLTLPDTIALVGGTSIDGNIRVRYSNDGDDSNDFIAAWTAIEIGWSWATYTFEAGFKVSFDGRFETLGSNEIALIGSWALAPELETVILSARWEEASDAVELVVIKPDGTRITESEFGLHDNIVLVDDLTSANSRHVALFQPEVGIWDIEVVSPDTLGEITYSASNMLETAELDILSVRPDTTNDTVTIDVDLELNDQRDGVLYFYANPEGATDERVILGTALVEQSGVQSVELATTQLAPGRYEFGAELVGSRTAPVDARDNTIMEIDGLVDLSIEAALGGLGTDGSRIVEVTIQNLGERFSGQVVLDIDAPEDIRAPEGVSDIPALAAGLNSFVLAPLAPGETSVVSVRLGEAPQGGDLFFNIATHGFQEQWLNNQTELSIPLEGEGPASATGRILTAGGRELTDGVRFLDEQGNEISASFSADGTFVLDLPEGYVGRVNLERDYDAAADGTVTALDALNVLRLAVGLSPSWGPASPIDFIAADINQDGQVTALDALEVLRSAVGLQSANQPRWIFMDSDADLSHIGRNDTRIEEGIRFDPTAPDMSSLSMTGVLLGNMQEYVQ